MRGLYRKSLGVALCLIVMGGVSTIAPARLAAATAGSCVISGNGEANPGVFVGLPVAEVYDFTGSATPCSGVGVVPGAVSGVMTCPGDDIAACVPVGTFSLTSSPFGACQGGTMTHQGLQYTVQCGLISGSFTVSPNPFAGTGFEGYTYTGQLSAASP